MNYPLPFIHPRNEDCTGFDCYHPTCLREGNTVNQPLGPCCGPAERGEPCHCPEATNPVLFSDCRCGHCWDCVGDPDICCQTYNLGLPCSHYLEGNYSQRPWSGEANYQPIHL